MAMLSLYIKIRGLSGEWSDVSVMKSQRKSERLEPEALLDEKEKEDEVNGRDEKLEEKVLVEI